MKPYDSAKKIIEKLRSSGYVAYFAGGWVRDFLLGHPSSDVDIATDAPPETIVKLFRHTIPVGIHFGVVIVVLEGHHFEVSTFRKDLDHKDGRRPEKIVLTNEQEDALRRDFTINGMFYDPFVDKVIDYVGGQEDLKKGVVKAIGNPSERFKEDKLRMIRAIRFAYRFGYQLEENTRLAIKEHATSLFPAVSMERIWQELKKMAEFPNLNKAILEMFEVGLLPEIFPDLKDVSVEELKSLIAPFAYFPKNCPPIMFFMELFRGALLEKQLAICHYLKVSNKDQQIVEFVQIVRNQTIQEKLTEEAVFAKLYANPLCDLALEIVSARLDENARQSFIDYHAQKKAKLKSHIERIINKTPLVTSKRLFLEGVAAGKKMGLLLQEAERISINQNIQNGEEILSILKQSKFWP